MRQSSVRARRVAAVSVSLIVAAGAAACGPKDSGDAKGSGAGATPHRGGTLTVLNSDPQQDFDPAPGAEAPQPLYTIKPYAIANAQVDYGPAQGKWTATAGVTNLTNKFYYYQLFGGGAINVSSNVAPPREYFFSVRRDF